MKRSIETPFNVRRTHWLLVGKKGHRDYTKIIFSYSLLATSKCKVLGLGLGSLQHAVNGKNSFVGGLEGGSARKLLYTHTYALSRRLCHHVGRFYTHDEFSVRRLRKRS